MDNGRNKIIFGNISYFPNPYNRKYKFLVSDLEGRNKSKYWNFRYFPAK